MRKQSSKQYFIPSDLAALSTVLEQIGAAIVSQSGKGLPQSINSARPEVQSNPATATDLPAFEVHKAAVVLIFRLLLIKHAETRGFLPIEELGCRALFSEPRLTDIASVSSRESVHQEGGSHRIWRCFRKLASLLRKGWKGHPPLYLGELFEPGFCAILDRVTLSDSAMNKILRSLRAEVFNPAKLDGCRLGRIYEFALECQAELCREIMVLLERGQGIHRRRLYARLGSLSKKEQSLAMAWNRQKKPPAGRFVFSGGRRLIDVRQPGEYVLGRSPQKTSRRTRGAYFTPRPVVKYMVDTVLDAVLRKSWEPSSNAKEFLGSNDILQLKILDPAMGAGVFLVEALKKLTRAYLRALVREGEITRAESTEVSTKRHALRRLAERCLYGVDIDHMTVELAKMSVHLAIAEPNGPPISLDHHFRCGDALLFEMTGPVDQSKQSSPCDDLKAMRLAGSSRARRKTMHDNERTPRWESAFPEAFFNRRGQRLASGGFDCIIGNPPYISLYSRESARLGHSSENLKALASIARQQINGFPISSGRLNYFALFIARAVQLGTSRLSAHGLVLPDTILTNESYAPYRLALTKSGALRKAVWIRNPVFQGATVGTALVFWGPERKAGGLVELIEADSTEALQNRSSSTTVQTTDDISNRSNCSWKRRQMTFFHQALLDGVDSITLSEIAHVKDGVNPGSAKTRAKLLTSTFDGDEALRPCLEGKCIQPHRLTWSSLWIRYAPDRISAMERRAGASLRKPWIFNPSRIVYRQTAPRIIAAVDLHGLCALNSVHNIILKEPSDDALFALCAFLNSSLFRDYYQAETGETRSAFPQVHISSMKSLRVPVELLNLDSTLTQKIVDDGRALAAGSEGLDQCAVSCGALFHASFEKPPLGRYAKTELAFDCSTQRLSQEETARRLKRIDATITEMVCGSRTITSPKGRVA